MHTRAVHLSSALKYSATRAGSMQVRCKLSLASRRSSLSSLSGSISTKSLYLNISSPLRTFATRSPTLSDNKPRDQSNSFPGSTETNPQSPSDAKTNEQSKSQSKWRQDVQDHVKNAEQSSSFSGYGSAVRTKKGTEHTGKDGEQDPDKVNE
ncbi:hypothetical protein ACM66B_004021 [Microbotryomycetes sp. NB124-2]